MSGSSVLLMKAGSEAIFVVQLLYYYKTRIPAPPTAPSSIARPTTVRPVNDHNPVPPKGLRQDPRLDVDLLNAVAYCDPQCVLAASAAGS